LRLAVYVDDVYRRDGETLTAGLAFPLFAAGLAHELEAVTLLGRLDPRPGRTHHEVPADVGFVALPFYASLGSPLAVAAGLAGALRRFWSTLGEVDTIWLLGPHPLALAAAALAVVRRRRVVLGVRQSTVEYARARYPGRMVPRLIFAALERAWRRLARRWPVVVVGPELAAAYAGAPRLLEIAISLVGEADLAPASVLADRDYDGEARILSVGRLEAEKNPLLLADVLALLVASGRDVRLVVCGDGALEDELARRLRELEVDGRAELLGYVPVEEGLRELYRSSHVFLHVSRTEGVPQVLFEAFAARLPVVATAVGGVSGAAAGAALLVAPDDPEAAAGALGRVLTDAALREELVESGVERARARSREGELARLARWLEGGGQTPLVRPGV